MPRVTVLPGGTSGGFAGRNLAPEVRGKVRGWSTGSARRLLAWLWSVNPDSLARSDGWALTLTCGTTPATSSEWHAARRAFQERLRRHGVELQQWVVEWTRKGRPHMHMAVYGPGRMDVIALIAWLEVCDKRGWPVSPRGQHIVPITGVSGWLQYVSKHAARGVKHYQRQGAPEGWESTGRLWGHSGDWPVEPPLVVDLEYAQFYRYRRLALAWQKARMRRAGVPASVWSRLGSHYGDRERGRMMGLSGWIPDTVSVELVTLALDAETVIHYDD